jgi:excisionase family DNA binding protein
MHTTDQRDLLRSLEAASLLGIDRATFNRWVAAGRIEPAVEFPGKTGARLFARADVEKLARERSAA